MLTTTAIWRQADRALSKVLDLDPDGQDLVGIISQGDIALALSATETAETVEAISR